MKYSDKLLKSLIEVSESLDLKSKAIEGAKYWINSPDFEIDRALIQYFKFEYKFQKLCFDHESLDYPYIEIQLDVYCKGEDIGYYCLYSLLDGEAIDDKLVITDDDFKYS